MRMNIVLRGFSMSVWQYATDLLMSVPPPNCTPKSMSTGVLAAGFGEVGYFGVEHYYVSVEGGILAKIEPITDE